MMAENHSAKNGINNNLGPVWNVSDLHLKGKEALKKTQLCFKASGGKKNEDTFYL